MEVLGYLLLVACAMGVIIIFVKILNYALKAVVDNDD